MKKRIFVSILILFVILIIGCENQTNHQVEEVPKVQESEVVSENDGLTQQINEEPMEEGVVEEDLVVEEVIDEEYPQDSSCTREFRPQFSSGPHYEGPLFDAHFHMPNLIDMQHEAQQQGHITGHITGMSVTDPVLGKDVELDKILCNFEKENVIGLVGLTIGAEQALDETIDKAKLVKSASGMIELFLMPVRFSTQALEKIQQSNPGLFKGYGEMTFYDQDYANMPPDSPKVMEVYEVAGRNDLIIMMHPGGRQETAVENAIKKNPNVIFLLHGFEIENSITNLIRKYPNVYYSIDAVLVRMPRQGPFLYTSNTKEDFKVKFSQNYDALMINAVSNWKSKIEQYPDRFTWGTDRGYLWHYDEEVGEMLEEFARDFIAKLDQNVQEKFAYKNAESLMS